MNTTVIRRITGATALLGAVCQLIELPLYFVYSGAPPDSNILTRSLFGLIGLTFYVVFMTGIGHLVSELGPQYRWLGTLTSTAGLMWLAVAFVSMGLEVGAVIQSPADIDPTIAVSGTYILYGTISKLLMGLFLFAFATSVRLTRILPTWTAWSAYVLALVNWVFVPSMFFGNTPAHFYAANGWGTTATTGGILMLWLLAVGVTLLRQPSPANSTQPQPA
ncbi:hypothetical protein K7711_07580 [Nocardia sp. CA2R105]|uniref:hypothetical protein n=1 Tax=Nocardia coffeae TaxID=2873381 RepID=UPI001CA6C3AF|nr:hypothetical protein [Nocardia coffeae]MBY8856331.1 hypothetical protein [Nocardia coffeae]